MLVLWVRLCILIQLIFIHSEQQKFNTIDNTDYIVSK
jgi:hypothetical protein